ncbi:MAG TPA: aldolase [Planctomycetes bacterium]|nr:aldolase [Planctomycetota bacterium]
MGIGAQIRLNRLFSHPSGRFCSVAVDHFIIYGEGIPPGLAKIRATLAAVAAGRPDAVTMHRGIATSAWAPHAGTVPFILQSTLIRPDDSVFDQVADAEDAVRLGADAIAVVAFVRGPTEGRYLGNVAAVVKDAARFELPVITHVYPRTFKDGVAISYAPEDIAWAVRSVMECGTDIVKVPFSSDPAAHAQIVGECTVPVVAAGGPKADTLEAALRMFAQVVRSGARGATVGRNIWGHGKIAEVLAAVKAVIHDMAEPAGALRRAGLA